MDTALIEPRERDLEQQKRILQVEQGTKVQTQFVALYNRAQSNIELQQISLRKLAARENREKGFEKAESSNGTDFRKLRGSTERLIRLLYTERMRGFKTVSTSKLQHA